MSRKPAAPLQHRRPAKTRQRQASNLHAGKGHINPSFFLQKGLAELSHAALAINNDIWQLCGILLDYALKITGSANGHADSIDPATGEHIFCGDATLQYLGSNLFQQQEYFNNSPSLHPRLANLGSAIFKINNILSLPIQANETLFGQITLVNATAGYSDQAVAAIKSLSEPYALALINRRRENALQESEAHYRLLIENAHDAVYLYEIFPDGSPSSFTDVNNVACQTTGYSKKELQKLTLRNINASGIIFQRNSVNLYIPGHTSFEAVHRTKNGNYLPVEVNTCSLKIRNHTFALSTVRDLTMQKQAEERLRRQNQYLHFLQNLSAQLLGKVDPNLIMQIVLDSAAPVFGVPYAGLGLLTDDGQNIRLTCKTTAASTSHPQVLISTSTELLKQALSKQQTVVCQDCPDLYQAFPLPVWGDFIAMTITPFRDNQIIIGFICLFWLQKTRPLDSDLINLLEQLSVLISMSLKNARLYSQAQKEIAERNQAEIAIRESEARYRAIMEQSSEAIALVDVKTLSYLEVNYQWTTFSGYSATEALQLTLADTLDASAEQLHALLENLRQTGDLPPLIRRYRCRDGRLLEVEQSASLIKFTDKQVYLFIFHAISAERKLQQQLSKDLFMAANLQRSLLPSQLSSSLVRIETIYEPFHAVSGDFFDYSWNREQTRLSGFILDIVGHGLASSLQTLAVSVLYRQTINKSMTLPEKLNWVNKHMLRYFPEETFAAAIIFELDFNKMTLTFATAGIYYFLSSSAAFPAMTQSPGSLIGIDNEPEYVEIQSPINSGDTFYFMSDGIYDSLPPLSEIETADFESTLAKLKAIASNIKRHDDCSALCLQIACIPQLPLRFQLSQYPERIALRPRLHYLLAILAGSAASQISIALEEALNNALRPGLTVSIKLNKLGRRLIIRIRDTGAGFAGNEIVQKFVELEQQQIFSPFSLNEHGRGIPIMMAWMERVIYNKQGNEILLMRQVKD